MSVFDYRRTQELTEDLIIEIILFLPWKFAVQCKCLSKKFNEFISDPTFAIQHALHFDRRIVFHYSSTCARIFGKFSLNPPHDDNYLSIGGEGIVISPVLSSRSGRLVLKFSDAQFYHIFNPVTGAYGIIPQPPSSKPLAIGLADQVTLPAFKLVAVTSHARRNHRIPQEVFRFEIFESENNCWREAKSMSEITCHSSTFVCASEPAYLHGSLHWLRTNGDILVFDVNSEISGLIKKPDDNILNISPLFIFNNQRICFASDTWFGIAEGSIALVIALKKKIVVSVRDYAKGQWQTKKIFENINVTKKIDLHRNGRPIFYDGKVLIFLAGVLNTEIYMYHIQGDTWKKIGNLPEWRDNIRAFHHFFPTAVKIPNCRYLNEKLTTEETKYHVLNIVPRLAKLQSVLLL